MLASLLDHLYENASLESEIAFIHRPRLRRKTWTYAELARTSFRFARELETRGIGRGDRVLLWAENSPEWVAAFYGIILRGAIAVPLDEQGSADFAARVCEQTSPKLLLFGSDVDCTHLNFPKLALQDLRRTIAPHSGERYDAESIQAHDTVEIVFTSGTTATPKGVELTHENLLANIAPIEREIDKYIRWEFLVHPLKILTVLPLSHVFGQMIGIFIPQLLRATVVFQSRLKPSEIIQTIKRERVSVLGTVPRVLETLQHKVESEYEAKGELGHFRESMRRERSWPAAWWKFRRVHRTFGYRFMSFVTGGATLDESTETFWRKLGFAVVQGYGMTETAALVSLNNPFSARSGSLGQILSGRENVRIGTNGEILVRGKNISPGYWGEDKRADAEEWLDTGDIGELDETGRLYFKGRKKDIIVTAAGLNIFPSDVEAALNQQPEIVSSAVVGIDGEAGPEPAAALILSPGTDAAGSVSRANKTLADYQRIRRWIEWPDADFPRTPTQKIRKNEIADVIEARLGIGEKTTASHSPLTAIIARLSSADVGGVGKEARLDEDLALDSLSRVELMSAVEDRYQVDLDEQAFTSASTIGDLENLVRNEGLGTENRSKFSYPRWPLKFPVSWTRPILYELVIRPITRILGRVNIQGQENLAGLEGPVLFASNHVTYVDPALIMSAMPGRFRRRLAIAMDGERLRNYLHPPAGIGFVKRVKWFFTYWLVVAFFNAFPLPRQSGFRQSFAFAGEAMDRGYNILIFPEGELTRDGSLQKFKAGIGLLGSGLETPIVPVSISGLYELRSKGQRGYIPPGSILVSFGEPMANGPKTQPTQLTLELQERVGEL